MSLKSDSILLAYRDDGTIFSSPISNFKHGDTLVAFDGGKIPVDAIGASYSTEVFRITLSNNDTITCDAWQELICDSDKTIPLFKLIGKPPKEIAQYRIAKATPEFGPNTPFDGIWDVGFNMPNEEGLTSIGDDVLVMSRRDRIDFFSGFASAWGHSISTGIQINMMNVDDTWRLKILCRSLGFNVDIANADARFPYNYRVKISGNFDQCLFESKAIDLDGYCAHETLSYQIKKIESIGMNQCCSIVTPTPKPALLEDFTKVRITGI